MTLQDYIKLAESAGENLPSVNLEFYYDSVKIIPAMAKALIEAEAALRHARDHVASIFEHNTKLNKRESLLDKWDLDRIDKALATIQALQEKKNEQR